MYRYHTWDTYLRGVPDVVQTQVLVCTMTCDTTTEELVIHEVDLPLLMHGG